MPGFDIEEPVEALIDAAIAADMMHGTTLLGLTSFYDDNGATGTRVLVPGRHGYDGPSDVHTSVADPATYPVRDTTAAAIYRKWEDRIYTMFYPYKTMPLPEDFDSAITGFEPLLQKLAINPETFPNVESGKAEDFGFKVDGNSAFTVIGTVSEDMSNYQGLTTQAYRTYFLDKFPIVTQRQYGVARMLLGAVAGEKLLWSKLQHDVRTLVSDATTAFEGGGVDLGGFLQVAGTVTAIASLIPAAGAVTGPAGTIIGLLQSIPSNPPPDPTYSIDGDSPDAKWASLQKARDTINATARSQEHDIATHMDKIRSMMTSDPGSFDIGRIDGDGDGTSESTAFGTETDASDVISDKGVIQVDTRVMIQSGEHLKTVSGEFLVAAGFLDGLLTSGPWSRSTGIGLGYDGHYQQTSALADALVTALVDTKNGLLRGGEVVQIAARRIDGSDAGADAALAKHARDVQAAGG